MRYFATSIPGLAAILADEIASLRGVTVGQGHEFDGRNDVVPFSASSPRDLFGLRVSEDVFVEVSTARRGRTARGLIGRLVDDRALDQALSVYGAHVQPLRARMTVRVIVRVLSERQILRSRLRDELTRRIGASKPRWRVEDPAALELWALETKPGLFRLGLRLTTGSMRHRGGRVVERPGALRPTVAAAMVRLLGRPSSDGALLDPFCGSGTILTEAAAVGWRPLGADLDPEAVEVARSNVQAAAWLLVADARRLPFAAQRFSAVASNLPFGKQYRIQGSAGRWFDAALGEMTRVTRPGATIVLLVRPLPAFERALATESLLGDVQRTDLRLLGMPTALWRLQRK
jgi:23S rRNA G2445 N2-methylase RlmL